MMLIKSLMHVSFGVLITGCLTFIGLLDEAPTEDGFKHYAEKPWTFMYAYIPALKHVQMPANTLINIPYTLLGIWWIYKIHKLSKSNPSIFTEPVIYRFYMFGWMAVFYGFVQLARILSQNHGMAILDQWYTLVIFSWLMPWCHQEVNGENSELHTAVIVTLSTTSYLLTLILPFAFEILLGMHIFIDIYLARKLIKVTQQPKKLEVQFWKVVLSCCGFVVLKLLDHILPLIHVVFYYISGHFLSKICDCLQFFFAFEFFFTYHNLQNLKLT